MLLTSNGRGVTALGLGHCLTLTHWRDSHTPVRMAVIKKTRDKVGEKVEKREPL